MLSTYAIWAVLRAKRIRFVRSQHRRQPHELRNSILTAVFTMASKVSDWQLEFLILIVPAVCAHTVLASHLILTNFALITTIAFLILAGPPMSFAIEKMQDKKQKVHWSKKHSDDEDENGDDDIAASPSKPKANRIAAEAELPFRVSIDSAADAAHAAALSAQLLRWARILQLVISLRCRLSVDTNISTAPQSPHLNSANSAFPIT